MSQDPALENSTDTQAPVHPVAKLLKAFYEAHGEPATRMLIGIVLLGASLTVLSGLSWLIAVTNPPFSGTLRKMVDAFWVVLFISFGSNILIDLFRWMFTAGDNRWFRIELSVSTRQEDAGSASVDEAVEDPAGVYADLGRLRPSPAVAMGEAFDITGSLFDDNPPLTAAEGARRDWARLGEDIGGAARRFEHAHSGDPDHVEPAN